MASEYLDADKKGVLDVLTNLYEAFFQATDSGEMVKLASEIRLQEVRVGLSPIDRFRLRWTIDQGETAAERTESRRAAKVPKAPKGKDPRGVLKMVG